ncbi:MAG TPA: PilZ domain-containing protein [Desulfosarcina sp.]|nr:PilZ domain-containing protein [Desulfosarcina sp.]
MTIADRDGTAEESALNDMTATANGQPDENKERRVFLNDRGEGTFICPACEKGVIKDLSQFADASSAVRLKCKCRCGNVYRVLVERRRHFRKPTDLVGTFTFNTGSGRPVKGLMRIRDISQSGVRFSVNSMPEFAVGDQLIIEFTLDDEERSQIREAGVVRRIQSNMVGFTFKTTDHYGKLGQYLFR